MIAAQTFRISPLIRITLTLFYIALLLPLPFLARMNFMLLGVTVLLMLVDFWSIWTATMQGIAIGG